MTWYFIRAHEGVGEGVTFVYLMQRFSFVWMWLQTAGNELFLNAFDLVIMHTATTFKNKCFP